MNAFLLAFAIGVLVLQQLPELPPWGAPVAGALVAAGLHRRLAPGGGRVATTLAFGLCLGLAHAGLWAQLRLADRLDPVLDGADRLVTGTVVGLPERAPDAVRFMLAPLPSSVERLPRRLRVSWYAQPGREPPIADLSPGDRVRLQLRLRRPTSQFNPGGFDHAGWYFAQGIGAKAYARSGARLAHGTGLSVDRLRDRLRGWIGRHASASTAPLLSAMAVGDQGAIDDAHWTVLRATGTAHLVAISGMHVSIVALLVGTLAGSLWRRVPALALRLPSPQAALLAGMLAALVYAALAGFGVPVTRAVLMLGVGAIALWRTRRPAAGRVLLLALTGVLLVDPWAVLSAGFWLSFGAVAALLLALSGRLGRLRRHWQFLHAQWAIGLLMAPLLLAGFGQLSLVAPLANLVAIPVVTLVVVPALLLALALGSAPVLGLAAWALEVLMQALGQMASWPFATWSGAVPPLPLLLLGLAGALMALLPRGTPARLWALAGPALMLAWSPPRPPVGQFDVRVFDVGQGLSVRVRTAAHVLLYDTGPRYFRGGDAGRSVVLPALRHEGIGRLDTLVLSHDDSDHTGGAATLLEALAVGTVVAGAGVRLPGRSVTPCMAPHDWTWDGVRFGWLHPTLADAHQDDNNRSCVLLVEGRGGRLLLTGDIQRGAEQALAARGGFGPVSAVVAPHHGSKSSSTDALVEAAGAEHVIFATGLDNPYGHPAPEVVARWRDAGARPWNTAEVGMISLHWEGDAAVLGAAGAGRRRYWHRPIP